MTSRRCYINGQRWTIRRCRVPSDRLGDCNYETRTIRVSRTLAGLELLDVLLHELTHARFPDLAEAAVDEFATTAAAVAHAFEFRNADHEPEK